MIYTVRPLRVYCCCCYNVVWERPGEGELLEGQGNLCSTCESLPAHQRGRKSVSPQISTSSKGGRNGKQVPYDLKEPATPPSVQDEINLRRKRRRER